MPRKKGKKRSTPSQREEVTHSESPSSSTVPDTPSDVPTEQLSRCAISEEAQPSHQVSTCSVKVAKEDVPNVLNDIGFEFELESPEEPVVSLLPRKPETPGKLGRKINLISNCFPLKFPRGNVYHYDVVIIRKGSNYTTEDTGGATNITPKEGIRKKYRCLNTKLNREVFKRMQDQYFPNLFAVFDGEKNMYSMDDLCIKSANKYDVLLPAENPGDPNDPLGPRMDIFEVYIKPVFKKETGDCIISLEPLHALFKGTVNSVPQEAFMALETVLRHSPCMRFVPVSRSFYYPPAPDEARPLGAGKEVWSGYYQSVRLGKSQAMVNLDISNTSFYESIPLIEYIAKFLNKSVRDLQQVSGVEKEDIKKLSKDLRNLCVEVTHMHYRRKYRIETLSDTSANSLTFSHVVNGQNVEVTIRNYFLQQYGLHLRFPHLPCIKTRAVKASFLPIEVCEVSKRQHSSKELNPRQQSEIIKVTARPPLEKFRQTLDVHKNSCYDTDPFLRKFEIEVLSEPIKVTGRTMQTPHVLYKRNSNEIRVRPENGSWNMRGIEFFTGTNIKTWTLLSFANPRNCPKRTLEEFAQSLCKFANIQGVRLGRCSHIEMVEPLLQGVRMSLQKMKEQFHADVIFVVLPVDDKKTKRPETVKCDILYSEVKRVAETNMGLVTQCVKGENVSKKCTDPSFISNLCLKLNAKMGGINNSMIPEEVSDFFMQPILIIGVDVNHPSPAEDIKHSLAAAVGSLDRHPSRYAVAVRAQINEKKNKKTLEVILEMKSMTRELLLAFYQNTNKREPQKIIIYRDGVSEGQFDDVQKREVKWIKEACAGMREGYKPRITFVVVQKNHHMKFIPQNPRDGVGAMSNVPPGTAVDDVVTHPVNFDFYLYSHLGLKGTSRPCYYTVLEDENNFSFDALQKLTYALCHTFVRCTKSISIPAPVRYAHLAAYRARRHLTSYLKELELKEQPIPKRLQTRDSKEKYVVLPEEVLRKAIQVQSSMANTMYFA